MLKSILLVLAYLGCCIALGWFTDWLAEKMVDDLNARLAEDRARWHRESPAVNALIAARKQNIEYHRRRFEESNQGEDHA